GIGIFLDGAGRDRYAGAGADNAQWGATRWGVGIDRDLEGRTGLRLLAGEKIPADALEKEEKAAPEAERLLAVLNRAETLPYPDKVECLLSVASHWGREEGIPERAKDRLLRLPPQKSLPAMTDLLDTPDIMSLIFMERFFLVHAFHAVPFLQEKIEDPDPLTRSRAFYYLGMLKDTRAVGACLGAMGDPSWKVRSNAASALGNILDRGRLENLIPMRRALKDARARRDPDIIREYLSEGERLPMLISVLLRALPLPGDTPARLAEMGPLKAGERPPSEVVDLAWEHQDPLLQMLNRYIGDIESPGEIGPIVLAGLHDPDPAVQKAAAYALGQLRHEAAVPHLVSLLNGPHHWVRDSAVLSLALFGTKAVRPLASALKGATPAFTVLALDALSRIGTDPCRALIETYLESDDENIRRGAERALGHLQQGS
ncbi:MAG: HEAT repeat domain-containing protein, partial [Deltaproteobacteria bacterium]|nr:HEAT repeat domain-containing protein [Deltaproteobacteria bacterium]